MFSFLLDRGTRWTYSLFAAWNQFKGFRQSGLLIFLYMDVCLYVMDCPYEMFSLLSEEMFFVKRLYYYQYNVEFSFGKKWHKTPFTMAML